MGIPFDDARRLAAAVGHPLVEGKSRESDSWWFFPVRQIGCCGIVVDKATGTVEQLGSAFAIDDWLWGYDHGIRGTHVDFTVTEAFDVEQTLEFLWEIRMCSRQEARQALGALPHCWHDVPLWMAIPSLRRVEQRLFAWTATPSMKTG